MSVNLTYRELKAMVPATPKGKMPKANKIKGEILFTEEVDGAIITVYKDGFLTYTSNGGNSSNNGDSNSKKSRKSSKGGRSGKTQKRSNGQKTALIIRI